MLSKKILLTLLTLWGSSQLQAAALPTSAQQKEDQWFARQMLKDEVISNPAKVIEFKKDIELLKKYRKSLDFKSQLFTSRDSLEKIKRQAAYMSKLADGFLKKSWIPHKQSRLAATLISQLDQKLSGYSHHPELIDKELSDLTIPTVRKRVEQLVELWDEAFKQLYQLGIFDSAHHVPGKENKNLLNINPWNEKLIFDAQGRILVVSWVPEYLIKFWPVGQQKVIQGFVPWVTAAPELHAFAHTYISKHMEKQTGFSLYERVSQLLGLPQLRDGLDITRYFVEMWVDPKDLVRPCLNSTIIGNGCYLDTQGNDVPATLTDIQQFIPTSEEKTEWINSKLLTVREWFNENKRTTYTGANAFPWARLGYTYDMGSLQSNKAGLSEFLIKPGSTVLVHAVIETSQYPSTPLPHSAYTYKGPRINH